MENEELAALRATLLAAQRQPLAVKAAQARLSLVKEGSRRQQKLQAEFTSGTGPDIFWVNTPWLSTWIKDGLLTNLAPDIAKAHINMSQYIPSLVSLHTYKGAIYGLPKDWDTIAVYYNVDYFAKHHIVVGVPDRRDATRKGALVP